MGTRRTDFLVEGKVVVELKALIKLEECSFGVGEKLCSAYDLPIGLLINFGGIGLQIKKLFTPKYNEKKPESGLEGLEDGQD